MASQAMLPGNTDNASSATAKQINDLPDELLVEVLSMMPPEDRYKIRRVSQKWNSILCDLGYHLDPHFIDEYNDHPNYPADVPIKVNPIFSDFTASFNDLWTYIDCHALTDAKAAQLLERRSEFATAPPISTMHLRVDESGGTGSPGRVRAILRTATKVSKRPEGIRVGDLLDTFSKLCAGAGIEGRVDGKSAWYGTSTYHSKYHWSVIQPAVGKSGIEVRK